MDQVQKSHRGKFSIDPTPKDMLGDHEAAYVIAEGHPGERGAVLKRWKGETYGNFEAAKEAGLSAAEEWLEKYRPVNG